MAALRDFWLRNRAKQVINAVPLELRNCRTFLREMNAGIWEFIGECYLYEMMDGQGLSSVNNSL
jgi:hypothetical protein